ncbi:MAG: FecR family protein [Sphingobacterium composti]
MNDKKGMSEEDFLIQNSFQQYCAGGDEACIKYWEKYIDSNPEYKEQILEARRLYFILNGSKRPLNQSVENLEGKILTDMVRPLYNISYWGKIAAAVVVVMSIGLVIYFKQKNEQLGTQIIAENSNLLPKVYEVQNAARKKLKLSDGTVVLLNAGSKLFVGKDFNKNIRVVRLVGEGFFEVAHNNSPFIVQTKDFNVKVLGTKFNVKSYDSDSFSEASLISGSVHLELVNRKNEILALKPGEKLVVRNGDDNNELKSSISDDKLAEIKLTKNTITDNNDILETAWTKNRLEIHAQRLGDIQAALERWYDVQIQIEDTQVGDYVFTAVFTSESIDEVLKALQKAKHFNFSKKDNTIIITK